MTGEWNSPGGAKKRVRTKMGIVELSVPEVGKSWGVKVIIVEMRQLADWIHTTHIHCRNKERSHEYTILCS